ncbi:MAG: rpsI [Nitrospira sp.]|jgi:small subunit ribosomal protein S9|nr:rpsI [Nitrospira sp.]
MAATMQYATGKRKSAIARAWVTAAAGDIVVNDKPLEKAFPRMTLRNVIQFPFELAGVAGKYSVRATVHGGGPAGQAGALRHAISKALVVMSSAFRAPLKKEGLLTRDSRVKERKKYGQKGARKRFQYSKR